MSYPLADWILWENDSAPGWNSCRCQAELPRQLSNKYCLSIKLIITVRINSTTIESPSNPFFDCYRMKDDCLRCCSEAIQLSKQPKPYHRSREFVAINLILLILESSASPSTVALGGNEMPTM